MKSPGQHTGSQPARKCPALAREDGRGVHVRTHVRKCVRTFAHACTSWEEPSKKNRNEMTASKARCPERKQKEDERQERPQPYRLRNFPRGGRPPDGSHLRRPDRWSHRDAGAAWPRGHVEWGSRDLKAAISARDLITRWALSRSLKNRKSI